MRGAGLRLRGGAERGARSTPSAAPAATWRSWAAALKERFRARSGARTSGAATRLALDAKKRPVDGVSSNIGHLLGTGILDREEQRIVVERLLDPTMFSGYGIRTLSTTNGAYWPLRYHAGSVWSHDTGIVIDGMLRDGFTEEAAQVAEGLLTAAEGFDYQLPELFGGHPADEVWPPVPYPASCRPRPGPRRRSCRSHEHSGDVRAGDPSHTCWRSRRLSAGLSGTPRHVASVRGRRAFLREHGTTYAEAAGIELADKPSPLFELLVLTMLSSTRISADIAVKPRGSCSAPAGAPQRCSTRRGGSGSRRWAAATDATTSTATRLEELSRMVLDEYGGDLRRIRPQGENAADDLAKVIASFPASARPGPGSSAARCRTWAGPYFDDRALRRPRSPRTSHRAEKAGRPGTGRAGRRPRRCADARQAEKVTPLGRFALATRPVVQRSDAVGQVGSPMSSFHSRGSGR